MTVYIMHACMHAYLKYLAEFRIDLNVQVCGEVDRKQSPEPQHCHWGAFGGAEQRPEGSHKAGFKLQMRAEEKLQAASQACMCLHAYRTFSLILRVYGGLTM